MVASPGVVVGVNDTPGSTLALRWAADEALLRHLPLCLIHAYRWPPFAEPAMYAISPQAYETEVRQHAESVLSAAQEMAREEHPGLEVSGEVIAGNPANALVERSAQADVLVVGSRQLGAVAGAVLGSVGTSVAARARCPVVVLRGPVADAGKDSCVVVGVDTTDVSEAALTFAFDQANRRQLLLRAVLCWKPPAIRPGRWTSGASDEAAERHKAALSEAIASWTERYPDVRIEARVLQGHPTDILVTESLTANLLVVGARGRRALLDTVLGSVSQGVLHHAVCPVAVVHG